MSAHIRLWIVPHLPLHVDTLMDSLFRQVYKCEFIVGCPQVTHITLGKVTGALFHPFARFDLSTGAWENSWGDLNGEILCIDPGVFPHSPQSRRLLLCIYDLSIKYSMELFLSKK